MTLQYGKFSEVSWSIQDDPAHTIPPACAILGQQSLVQEFPRTEDFSPNSLAHNMSRPHS